MTVAIGPEGRAFLKLQAKKVLRALDNSVDVASEVEGLLEEVYSVALVTGVTAGVESVTGETFEKSVRRAVRG